MSATARAKWLIIAALAVLDAIGMEHYGLRLVYSGLAGLAAALALCATVILIYDRWRPDERVVDLAQTTALLFAFFAAAGVFSYLAVAATATWPPVDEVFARADEALGFDWRLWFRWVEAHPLLHGLLRLTYMSATPQIPAIILYLSLTGRPKRGSELMWTMMLSLLIIIPLSALLPAMSAFGYYRLGLDQASYMPDLLALRNGAFHEIDLARMQGLVTFPSFHATLGVLFTYVLRKNRALCGMASVLNALMILSVMSEGGHYLVDAIAGTAVAVTAIWATERLQTRLEDQPLLLSASAGE